MNRIFSIIVMCLGAFNAVAGTTTPDDHPSEYTAPEKIRADLDRLERFVHRKLGLNDLDRPTGQSEPQEAATEPEATPEPEAVKMESMYDKNQITQLHAKLSDQNTWIQELMDRIERLEHQDNVMQKSEEGNKDEMQNLKEHVASLQNQLDLATVEIERLRSALKANKGTSEDQADGALKPLEDDSEDGDKNKLDAPTDQKKEGDPVPTVKAESFDIDLEGKDPKEVYELAQKYLGAAEYAKAKYVFDYYVGMDISDSEKGKAYYYLGEINNMEKQISSASNFYLKSYQADPKGPHAPESLVKLGLTLNKAGKEKECCAALNQARKEYPKMKGPAKTLLNTKYKEFKCKAN